MKKYRKYRIRHNKGLLPYKVQRKTWIGWKSVFKTDMEDKAIDYIRRILVYEVYTKDSFKHK